MNLSFKQIIILLVFLVFFIFTFIMFSLFNNFYMNTIKTKFIDEVNYSAKVAKDLIEEEKNKMTLISRELAKSDVLFYAVKEGIYIGTKNWKKDEDLLKIEALPINRIRFINILNAGRRDEFIHQEIFKYDKTEKKFTLLANSSGLNSEDRDSENEKFLFDSMGDGIVRVIEISLIDIKGDNLYIKSIVPIGLDTRWIPVSLATSENIPGLVVSFHKIDSQILQRIKKIVNKEVIIIKDGKIKVSTMYDDKSQMISGQNININNFSEDFYNCKIKISEKNMLFTFFPIKNYEGKTVAFLGTGILTSEIESMYSKSIKKFIYYEIIFSILLSITLYTIVILAFNPLDRIVNVIKDISKGFYNNKITIRFGKELKILCESINTMSETIKDRETELKKLNESLKSKVEEQTEELRININRLKSIEKMIHVIYIEKSERNAIYYVLATITSIIGLNFKLAIYLKYENNNILSPFLSFYNIDEFQDINIQDIEIEEEKNISNEKIILKDIPDIEEALSKSEILFFEEKNYKHFSLSNFCIVPVIFEKNKYGVILAEKYEKNGRISNEEIDILKILSINLGVYFENRTLEKESLENEKLSALVKFAESIVHEIRTPITGIKGLAQILKNIYQNDKKVKNYSEIILRETERVDGMASDFLEYVYSDKTNFTFTKTNLKTIIEVIVKEFLEEFSANKINFKIALEDVSIYCDEKKIKKALMNIIKNSIEASKGYDDYIEIILKGTQEGAFIKISDRGIGISKENINKICEPLFTTKIQGTGLGIPITINIIKKHSGTINISSEKGNGTSVEIFLKREPN